MMLDNIFIFQVCYIVIHLDPKSYFGQIDIKNLSIYPKNLFAEKGTKSYTNLLVGNGEGPRYADTEGRGGKGDW